MGIPVYTGLQELDAAPRRFLLFIVFNVISWQCIVGPVLVLFARHIHMPEGLVGNMLAFMPLSMVLVTFTGRFVRTWGPKPVMLSGWALRNLIACAVFLMPFAMERWGLRAGWAVLMVAIFGFCLMRTVGAGGWLPWLYEVVPGAQRGAYFSSEAAVTQLLSVFFALGTSAALVGEPGIGRYLGIFAVGIASGFVSLVWMLRVPGGVPEAGPERATSREDVVGTAWRDGRFRGFVLTASFSFSSFAWLNASSILYMRDALMLSSMWIMLLQALASVGVLLTIRSWTRFADHSGSGRAILLIMTGYGLVAASFLFLPPGHTGTYVALVPIVVAAGVFGSAYWAAVNRAMLNRVNPSYRVGYSNLWTVMTNLALGATPVAAGFAIEGIGLWGYRLCFLASAATAVACAFLMARTLREKRDGAAPAVPRLSVRGGARLLGHIVRISLGLHESNRGKAAPGR